MTLVPSFCGLLLQLIMKIDKGKNSIKGSFCEAGIDPIIGQLTDKRPAGFDHVHALLVNKKGNTKNYY